MIILDTSFLIDYFKGVEEARKLISGEKCVTTVITYHEIMTGIRRLDARREETFFRRLFSTIKVLEYDIRAAEESSKIAAKLTAIGRKVNALDTLIAGIAVANGIKKIATRDKDFLEIANITDIDILMY